EPHRAAGPATIPLGDPRRALQAAREPAVVAKHRHSKSERFHPGRMRQLIDEAFGEEGHLALRRAAHVAGGEGQVCVYGLDPDVPSRPPVRPRSAPGRLPSRAPPALQRASGRAPCRAIQSPVPGSAPKLPTYRSKPAPSRSPTRARDAATARHSKSRLAAAIR